MSRTKDDPLYNIVTVNNCSPEIVVSKHLVEYTPVFERHSKKLTALLDVLNSNVEIIVGIFQESIHIIDVRLQDVDYFLFTLGRSFMQQVYAE